LALVSLRIAEGSTAGCEVVVGNGYYAARAAEHVDEFAGLLSETTSGFDDKGDDLLGFN
jgi:hypothetical protein